LNGKRRYTLGAMPERKQLLQLTPVKPAAGDRLDSWKEIAAYLGREPRTVRRWEKDEGLPVHRLQHGRGGSVYARKSELDAWLSQRSGESAPRPPAKGRFRTRWVLAAAAVLALALIAAAGLVLWRSWTRPGPAAAVPLTSDPGAVMEPSLAPNARQVAYVWNGEAQDNFDIYVRMLAGGAPLRLTTDPADDYSPAWSPDSATIAFLRRTSAGTAAVVLVPVLGGVERKIAELFVAGWPHWGRGPSLAWSPDGKWLVAPGSRGPNEPDMLLRISPATGEMRPLASLPPKMWQHMAPAISPDGRTLAFSRMVAWGRSELCLLALSQDLLPAGEVRRLETGATWNASPAWLPDGRSLVFSTGSVLAPHLERIAVSGSGRAERLAGIGTDGWTPSLARADDGRVRLAYMHHYESVNIWRSALDGSGPPVRLIASAHWSFEPAWSSDGKRIVFISDRTGDSELWVTDAGGRQPQQWTFLKQPRLGGPRWSPDGRRIAFTVPGDRPPPMYLIDAPGAVPKLVPGADGSGYLEWAPDGRAIYFSANRGAHTEIWKIAPEGGEAVQVTHGGGGLPAVSSDGRFLYYAKGGAAPDERHLWRAPLGSGSAEKVLDYVDAYSLSDAGIAFKYYRPGAKPAGPYLEMFRFATGKTERLPDPRQSLRYGIALSRDGRYLLHAQADYAVSDLMLVEGFR